MAVRSQFDVRTFEQGLIESVSEFSRTASFNSAQEVWLMPGYEGVLGEYGPYVQKETATGPAPYIISAITAKDSSGNVLRVVHDRQSDKIKKLNADGTLGSDLKTSLGSVTTPTVFTVYDDQILCFNGTTTPFKILIASPNTVTNIGLDRPTVTNASTSLLNTAGNVSGTVKYYIAEMSSTTEGALSVAFGEADAGTAEDGQGNQVSIDLSHGDFVTDSGSDAAAHAGTQLSDTVKTTTWTDGADEVSVGDAVVNVTDGSHGVVTGVTDTILTHTQLAGGSDNSWDAGDDWRVAPFYRIYRTYANSEAPNHLAQVPGGGTYTDNIPDDDLGDLPRLHGDVPPAAITAVAVYNEVVYGLAGNTLYFSDPGEEESWWTATDGNSIGLDRGDGDVGTALFVEPDGVVIFKRHHILKLLGTSPEDFRLIPVTPSDQSAPSVGTEGINTICGIPGGAFFYYEDGFYVYSQGMVRRVSQSIDRLFFADLIHSPTTGGVVRYDPRFGIVHCAFKMSIPGSKTTANAGTLAFHVPSARWVGVGKMITGLTSQVIPCMMYDPEQGEFSVFEYDPGGIIDDYKHYWITPDQDLGAPKDADLLSTSDAQFVLPRFYGATEFNEKRFLWAEVEALGTASADGTMKVEYSINGAAYATAGTATLGATRAKYRLNIGEYGREMDLRFTLDEGFRIYRVIVAFQEFGSKAV